MGSERAATAGKVCAQCGNTLPDTPPTRGERLCMKCKLPGTYRIYMYFIRRKGWVCQFLEEDLKTPLPHRLHFKDAEKIRTIVERVGNFANLQDRQALDYGLGIGRGGAWLQLTEKQYMRLKAQGESMLGKAGG